MAKRLIDTELWNNEEIIENFTAEDKYFWLYLLTSPHNNICGVFKNSPNLIARDMGLHKDTIVNLLYRFEKMHNLIYTDKETNEVLILNWYKFNWTKSPKILTMIEKEILSVKSQEIINALRKRVSIIFEKVDTVSIGYPYPTNTNSNTNTTEKPYQHLTQRGSFGNISKSTKIASTKSIPFGIKPSSSPSLPLSTETNDIQNGNQNANQNKGNQTRQSHPQNKSMWTELFNDIQTAKRTNVMQIGKRTQTKLSSPTPSPSSTPNPIQSIPQQVSNSPHMKTQRRKAVTKKIGVNSSMLPTTDIKNPLMPPLYTRMNHFKSSTTLVTEFNPIQPQSWILENKEPTREEIGNDLDLYGDISKFAHSRKEWKKENLLYHLPYYGQAKQINILTCTWNVNQCIFSPEEVDEWTSGINYNPDLVVCGLQELDMSVDAIITGKKFSEKAQIWRDLLNDSLNRGNKTYRYLYHSIVNEIFDK